MRHKLVAVMLGFAAVMWSSATAMAAFDPSNDDTDLFLGNPATASARANVVIFWDNTANWQTRFAMEKLALSKVLIDLNSDFNVGLMMYTETGAGNGGVGTCPLRLRQHRERDWSG